MIFNGGGFKTAMFLGMLAAAEENDLKPDYIIATCGGGLAAAISHCIDDPKQRLEILLSQESYQYMKSVRLSHHSNLLRALKLVWDMYVKHKSLKIIPNIFDHFLMYIPDSFEVDAVNKGFTPGQYKTLIVASKILYSKEEVGKIRKNKQKLFQEVVFTDEETAKQLQALHSPIADFNGSTVANEILPITGAKLTDAARASVADPFYIKPSEINGELYVTGAIDLYPVELAKALGDELMLLYPGQFSFIEEGLVYATYNYSQNERHHQVFTQNYDYLLDYSQIAEELVFTPKLDLKGLKVISRVPQSYELFKELVQKQYEYGFSRMLEAIQHPNSKDHIRNDFYVNK